ncbi:MAG: hypothetical protein WC959_08795 [Kiritimatiellales bacterium]
MKNSKLPAAILTFFVLISVNFALAAVWWSGAEGDWSAKTNWDGGKVPPKEERAYIDNGGTATVSDSQFVTTANAGWNASGAIIVAKTGVLNSTGGSINLGRKAKAIGTLTVDGGTVISGVGLYTGYEGGGGTINVLNGGTITLTSVLHLGYSNSAAPHKLTIDGKGSKVVAKSDGNSTVIARAGSTSAMVEITNGGRLISAGDAYTANTAKNTATVLIDGTGSEWKIGKKLYIVNRGTGTLTIQNGGLVSAKEIFIGEPGSVRMGGGGMLAVADGGKPAKTMEDFLQRLVTGSGNIQYWNGSEWVHISKAVINTDYTLDTFREDSTSYSRLTVTLKR